jgi:hypothetical protein
MKNRYSDDACVFQSSLASCNPVSLMNIAEYADFEVNSS